MHESQKKKQVPHDSSTVCAHLTTSIFVAV
jgi:hypothetical protein